MAVGLFRRGDGPEDEVSEGATLGGLARHPEGERPIRVKRELDDPGQGKRLVAGHERHLPGLPAGDVSRERAKSGLRRERIETFAEAAKVVGDPVAGPFEPSRRRIHLRPGPAVSVPRDFEHDAPGQLHPLPIRRCRQPAQARFGVFASIEISADRAVTTSTFPASTRALIATAAAPGRERALSSREPSAPTVPT